MIMNVFDIIGPVMIGPSSSHTAGACRIGNYAREIFGSLPKEVTICFSGSFAKTYKGHGTDKAVVAGLLGIKASDEKLRDSLEIAKREGMDVKIVLEEIELAHPNTVRITAKNIDGETIEVTGSSIGGGNILITRINDIPLEIDGRYDTLIIAHKDIPGMITKISSVLSNRNINVNGLKLFRSEKGGKAVIIVQVDEGIKGDEIIKELKDLEDVQKVTFLKALKPM